MLDNEGLSYIPDSYRVFGNNGTHFLNGSISTGTGAAPSILSMLEEVSDHWPVVADYQVPALMAVTVGPGNVPTQVAQGSIVEFEIRVENVADVVSVLGADELDNEAIGSNGVIGSFSGSDPALGGGNAHTLTLGTSTTGMNNGEVVVENYSPESPFGLILPFDFEVIAAVDSADFDQELDVDGDDDLTWQRGFAVGTLLGEGDANGSGLVDTADLTIGQQQFGDGQPRIVAGVPEPSTCGMILFAYLACYVGRARRHFDCSPVENS